ncbi:MULTISPECIES: pentapeptide repeat-containing protein [Arthrobacter]|uniref:Pentapeptide repeat-containing protein n=2 Tax=Arthrobacter TaxID=1663 RepID=A0ABU9KLS5_9MICC|nr:pentapeptide repeat-containing protein [Arthrobacter sp. YJM1]MDP5228213.1 pentapeptide repeat-containing protein [Arthrobacter sp. YJM1]
MAQTARKKGPAAPRVSAPDLPRALGEVDGLRRYDEVQESLITGLEGEVDAGHANLNESILRDAKVDRLDLTGATLVDVEIEELQATELVLRNARVRRVRLAGGRIGTLDLSGAEIDSLELRDVRIDYLGLSGSTAQDVKVSGCRLRTLDVPLAKLKRVAFQESQAEEVDSRDLDAADVDLRGLDAHAFTAITGLRGATLTESQVRELAVQMAFQAGIQVTEG